MSDVAASRRNRLRKTKAQLIEELEQLESRIPGGGFVAAKTTISEHESTERALANSQQEPALKKLTSGIAHEFNNLLMAIIGNLRLMDGRIHKQSPLKRHVKIAYEAAHCGAELTNLLLAIAGSPKQEIAVLDSNRFVEGMESLIRDTLGDSISLEINLSDELWPVMADPDQLGNALLNLVINAKNALPEGGKLIIETANVNSDDHKASQNREAGLDGYVAITFDCAAHGKPSDDAYHALGPTRVIDKDADLGLSLVYGFIKRSNGDVKIYVEPGPGKVVTLFLPRLRSGDGSLINQMPAEEETVRDFEPTLEVEGFLNAQRTAGEPFDKIVELT